MQSIYVLGVRVDKVDMDAVLAKVEEWVNGKGKHYIVTTNIEFIMAAEKDERFRKILNDADLSIADSARFGWVEAMLTSNPLIKIFLWPLFLFPKLPTFNFPIVTGTDLVEKICKQASKKGWKVGLLGGKDQVAKKAAYRLKHKYPRLKISFAESGEEIDKEGFPVNQTTNYQLPTTNLLFIAFGHVKQEKWIDNYKDKINGKVFMGVGGALDYISGSVSRAPKLIRDFGFEWLYRLMTQPWRIKRFGSLLEFVYKIMIS